MRPILFAVATLALLSTVAVAATDTFKDPLDVPSAINRLAATTQLSGVAYAGKRLVAVGVRGLITTSDDGGATWIQRSSPVSSDLLAVQFPTELDGWAVGQDGVVLHSGDSGLTWQKQLDGRQAGVMLIAHFRTLAAAGDPAGKRLLPDIELNYGNGPEQALLDVAFDSALHGFVCGSFGTLLETHDGGKTWGSALERVDYGSVLHFNAIRTIGGETYIASEKGIVFRLDRETNHFVPVQTGYEGTFFTLTGRGDTVLAGGLRGSLYRSDDAGQSWHKLDTGLMASVTAAGIGTTGQLLIASQSGDLLMSSNDGNSFTVEHVARPTVFFDVLQTTNGNALLVGLNGVQQVHLR